MNNVAPGEKRCLASTSVSPAVRMSWVLEGKLSLNSVHQTLYFGNSSKKTEQDSLLYHALAELRCARQYSGCTGVRPGN